MADDTLQSGVKWESNANFGAFSEEFYEIGPAGEIFTTRTLAGGGVGVMKFDGFTGRPMWSKSAILDAAESVSPRGLAIAPSGDLYVASMTSAGAARIARLSGIDGALIWTVMYDTPASDDAKAIEALPGGGVVILVQQGSDFSTVAFEPTFGGVAWSDTIATPVPETAVAMTIAPGGDIVIGGTRFVEPNNDALVVKYSASGTRRWLRTFDVGSTAVSAVSHLVADGGGDVFVAGGTQISPNPRDWLVARLDGSDGGVVWATTFGDMGANEDLPSSAVVDGDGNFIVSGTRIDSIFNYAVVKFANSDGSMIWTAPQGSRTPRQLVLHPAGDVFSFGIGSWNRADVVRFRGVDGAHYQPLEIAFPVGQGLAPDKIVHDAAGNAFVLGMTGSTTSVTKITAGGNVAWTQSLSAFESTFDIGVDSAGDVLVAGYGESYRVARTGKLSGSTGNVVWTSSSNAGGNTSFEALTIDAGDNVYVTGQSGDWTEALTAKFSSAGVEQWYRFSALAGSESGRDIVLDSAGNIVVVGQAGPVAMILRYDSAGTLVSPVTLGTTSDVMIGTAIADSAGNVYGSGTRYNGSYSEPHIFMVDSSGAIAWSDTIAVGANTLSEGLALSPHGAVIIASAWGPPGSILATYTPGGARLWVQYFAPDERTELPDVDITGDGGIVVAGRVEKTSGYSDTRAVFAKFDSANGASLWTVIRDNGTSNDGATCIDAVGNDIYIGMAAGGEAMVARYGPALGILQIDGDLPVAYCNTWYSFTLAAANGSGSYSWSAATGLPPGMALSSAGELSGTPTAEGSFTFTVSVNDGSLTVEREFTLDVWRGSPYVAVNASADPLCRGDSSLLSLGAIYGSYDWLPTHEVTPSISVSPLHPAIFGVNADAAACSTFGSIVVDVLPLLTGVSVSSSGSTTVCEGATAGSLTVFDTGGGARTHQWWYRTSGGDSFAIPGETGRTWVIDAADLPGPGTYEVYCITTPQCGVPTGSNAMTVTYPQLSAPSGLVATASAPDSISLVWAAG
ncbi:MAG: hypothetical protein ACYC9N_17025, partial [Thermoanaerobaculia bacterium]